MDSTVHLATVGPAPSNSSFEITAEMLAAAVELFGAPVPVDSEESLHRPRESPALGWVSALCVLGDELLAKVHFTAEGKAQIRKAKAFGRPLFCVPTFLYDRGPKLDPRVFACSLVGEPSQRLRPVELADEPVFRSFPSIAAESERRELERDAAATRARNRLAGLVEFCGGAEWKAGAHEIEGKVVSLWHLSPTDHVDLLLYEAGSGFHGTVFSTTEGEHGLEPCTLMNVDHGDLHELAEMLLVPVRRSLQATLARLGNR